MSGSQLRRSLSELLSSVPPWFLLPDSCFETLPRLPGMDRAWPRSVSRTNPLLSKWLSVRVCITVTDRELEAKSLASFPLSVSSFAWRSVLAQDGEGSCVQPGHEYLFTESSLGLAASSGMWFGSLLSGLRVICCHYLWPQEKIPTYSGHHLGQCHLW